MDLLEVASGVFAVEASHTNFVLITDGDEITLVDSGYPRDQDLVEAAVAQTGHTVADLSVMLLTHAHVDHIGAAEWLRREHDVPIQCHADEAAHARGEIAQVISPPQVFVRAWRPGVASFLLNALRSGALAVERVAEVDTFHGPSALDVPGRPVPVHTPGHTSGHVSFHLPDRGVLLAGDELLTVDVWNRNDRGPQLIRPIFNHDHDAAIASLARIEDLEADVVVPGHGRPYRGTPAQAVAEARRRL